MLLITLIYLLNPNNGVSKDVIILIKFSIFFSKKKDSKAFL